MSFQSFVLPTLLGFSLPFLSITRPFSPLYSLLSSPLIHFVVSGPLSLYLLLVFMSFSFCVLSSGVVHPFLVDFTRKITCHVILPHLGTLLVLSCDLAALRLILIKLLR